MKDLSAGDAELLQSVDRFVAAEDSSSRLGALVDIVFSTRKDDAPGGPSAMVESLLRALETDDELRTRFGLALAHLLSETDATNLIGYAGIPGTRGFFTELSGRVSAGLLPSPRNLSDLRDLFGQLFRTEKDIDRFASRPLELFHRTVTILRACTPEGSWDGLQSEFCDGFRILLSRVCAESLSEGLRARATSAMVSESPFFQLQETGEKLLVGWTNGSDMEELFANFDRISGHCRQESRAILQRLDASGVSVDVVFSLEVIERCLTRTAIMVDIMQAQDGPLRTRAIHKLMTRLLTFTLRDRSLGDLISWNLHLLSRKIVDRSADTGEHYIAKNRSEYWHIWLAAAGGGLLTVGTALNKAMIHTWHLPPLPEGLLYGLNYAGSFLLLQHLGLILATKQPAMTAARFAAIIRNNNGEDRENSIVDSAARLVSSQLAAAFANVLVVAMGTMAFVWLWNFATGLPIMDAETAQATMKSMSPFHSGTIVYAAVTGVILWLASVIGGWFDNWCVCNRIPEALMEHPAATPQARSRWQRFGRMLEKHASGWGTNISLGFMLGMLPQIGRIAGIPLDVRHVTLNTGICTLAAVNAADSPELFKWLAFGVFGISIMFVINLSVSFACSLASAGKAYGLSRKELWDLIRSIGRRMLRKPGQFIIGPR